MWLGFKLWRPFPKPRVLPDQAVIGGIAWNILKLKMRDSSFKLTEFLVSKTKEIE